MPVVGSEPLAVAAVPGANDVVFGDGEDDVAIGVVSCEASQPGRPTVVEVEEAHFTWVKARSYASAKC